MEFLGLIFTVAIILGGAALTAYLSVEGDSIIAVLASIFVTFVLACAVGGITAAHYEKNRAAAEQAKEVQQVVHTTHTHCPYCNEIVE